MTVLVPMVASDAYLSALRAEIGNLSYVHAGYFEEIQKMEMELESPFRDYILGAFTQHLARHETGIRERTKMLGNLLGFKYEPVLSLEFTTTYLYVKNLDLCEGDKLYFEKSTPFDVELVTNEIEAAIALLEAQILLLVDF